MRKYAKKRLLAVLAFMLVIGLAYVAGFETATLRDSHHVEETVTEVGEQIGTEKIIVLPEENEGLIASYDENNKLVSLDKLPMAEPFTPSPEPIVEDIVSNETLIGSDFKLYHYAPTGNATASGRMPEVGTTVAVDPKYIKLGSWLRIEIPDGNGGYKVYRAKARADDTGGDIKGHIIDVFVGSNSEAIQCGVIRNAKVYLIEE